MYLLTHNGTKYSCENLPIKGASFIECVATHNTQVMNDDGGLEAKEITEPLRFDGITDFSLFSLTDKDGNSVEFEGSSTEDDELIMQLAIAEVFEKQLVQDADILTTQLAVAEIYELLG